MEQKTIKLDKDYSITITPMLPFRISISLCKGAKSTESKNVDVRTAKAREEIKTQVEEFKERVLELCKAEDVMLDILNAY